MMHVSPRWRKALRDLYQNKARTLMIVLSLTIGIFTVSLLINAESVLRTAFDRQFASINPSSATLLLPEGFDKDYLPTVRHMDGIQEADGLRSVNVRLKTEPNQWINLRVSAFPDYNDIRINKVLPFSGAWPPAKGEILLERSSLTLAAMPVLTAGDPLTIQTSDGTDTTLKFSGVAYDFNQTPSQGTGIVYGYVTLDTLEKLKQPANLNELTIVVAQNKLDKTYIRQVAEGIKQGLENNGRTVSAILVPDPGQHPLGTVLDALDIILGSLSILTLVGGALLVFNMVAALVAQQVRQIGIMKSIGARVNQIAGMYLGMVTVFGLLAIVVAGPLASLAGMEVAKLLANIFNLDLHAVKVPGLAIAVEVLIGLGIPFLAAIYPIWSGTRITVREALADYGLGSMDGKPGLAVHALEQLQSPFFPRPVLLSLRNTFRRRGRLILTLLPLALSGAILITVVNVRNALQSELQTIFSYRNYSLNLAFENPTSLAEIENIAQTVPGVTRIEGYHETSDAYRVLAHTSQATNISVIGVAPTTDIIHLPVLEGRWLTAQDQDAVVVNDALVRDEPDLHPGARVLFKINGRNVTLQVVGVVEEKMATDGMYLNDAYYGKVIGDVDRVNNAWIMTSAGQPLETIASTLEGQFEKANVHVASLTTVDDQRSFIDFHFSIMIIPLSMAALLLALVGGLGLMGTMSTNVLERQREIGVMRAIGASNGGVQQVVITEGLFIGLISWLISMAAAWPVTYVLDSMVGNQFLYTSLPFTYPLSGWMAWLIIVLVTAVLSCTLPARNASQTSVRELLAYE